MLPGPRQRPGLRAQARLRFHVERRWSLLQDLLACVPPHAPMVRCALPGERRAAQLNRRSDAPRPSGTAEPDSKQTSRDLARARQESRLVVRAWKGSRDRAARRPPGPAPELGNPRSDLLTRI